MSKESLHLGERIKQIRESLGLTQPELGERTGTNRGKVNNIERGSQKPPIDFLIELAKLSKLSIDELVGMDNQSVSVEISDLIQLDNDSLDEEAIGKLKSHIVFLEKELKNKDSELQDLKMKFNELVKTVKAVKTSLSNSVSE